MTIWSGTSGTGCSGPRRRDPGGSRPRGTRRWTARGIATPATLLLAAASGAAAQQVDAGQLELRAQGQRVGVENFRVWRAGSTLNAVASIERADGGTFQVGLQLGADFRPIRYELDDGERRQVEAIWAGDRVRLHTISPEGERWRELPARGVGTAVEEGVAHHHLLLVQLLRRAPERAIPVVIPSRARIVSAQLVGERSDEVLVGDRAVAATRYEIRIGDAERRVWLDAEDRLLRVADPSGGREALRLPSGGGRD